MRTNDIGRRFRMWHYPTTDEHAAIAFAFRALAELVNCLPKGRESAKALNRLEEAMMWSREAIEHQEKGA